MINRGALGQKDMTVTGSVSITGPVNANITPFSTVGSTVSTATPKSSPAAATVLGTATIPSAQGGLYQITVTTAIIGSTSAIDNGNVQVSCNGQTINLATGTGTNTFTWQWQCPANQQIIASTLGPSTPSSNYAVTIVATRIA
jgi:hypothetical protein